MKVYRCTPVKDEKGMIDIDVTEIYNVEDPSERYPAGFNQWRIGERIQEQEIIFHEKVAYNKNLIYLMKWDNLLRTTRFKQLQKKRIISKIQ